MDRGAVTNPPRKKGTKAEGEVLRWLTGVTGYPLHRHALHGNRDVGDIGNLPETMLEVKAGKPDMAAWLRQLDVEQANADTRFGFIVWRTPGTTDPHQWVVIARPDRLLRPRYPVPGPTHRLPLYVRRCAAFANTGVNYVGANVGYRSDGTMPDSVEACDAVAMTGGAFEAWLGENVGRVAASDLAASGGAL